MLNRLLADPTVALNRHSGIFPFVVQFVSLIPAEMGKLGPESAASPCFIRFFILRQRSDVDNLAASFYHHVTKPGQYHQYFQLIKNYSPRTAPQMIKQDLIQRVVERTGLPRTKAESAVDAIFESMKQTLIAGDRIELRGFGVFTVKPRKTGIGRNPRTGAEVTIAPGKAVRFKPGKELHLID